MNKVASHPRAIRILGTSHVLPSQCVSSGELDTRLGLEAGTLERKTGVRRRYFAADGDTAAELAAQACRKALAASGLDWSDIDCLVAASGTPDQCMPSNSALIHRELGLNESGIPAFDINASCLGFLAAMDMVSWPLVSGRYRRVMLVCADIASCGLDWRHLDASGIFGDGAAAAVIGNEEAGSGGSRILASSMLTLSQGAHYCEIPGGGSRFHPDRTERPYLPLTKFHMDGKAVFKLVSNHLPSFLRQLLDGAGLDFADLQLVIPHQASQLAIHHLQDRLKLASEKVVNIFPDFGNQVSASLPTALDTAISSGRMRRGDRVLLIGTSAGVSLGGMILVY